MSWKRPEELTFYAPLGTIWHQEFNPLTGCYRDMFRVYIVLTNGIDRYMRCVQVTGKERETPEGMLRMIDAMRECALNGTAGMLLVEDGGYLPEP